jgi:hypothetical protein
MPAIVIPGRVSEGLLGIVGAGVLEDELTDDHLDEIVDELEAVDVDELVASAAAESDVASKAHVVPAEENPLRNCGQPKCKQSRSLDIWKRNRSNLCSSEGCDQGSYWWRSVRADSHPGNSACVTSEFRQSRFTISPAGLDYRCESIHLAPHNRAAGIRSARVV